MRVLDVAVRFISLKHDLTRPGHLPNVTVTIPRNFDYILSLETVAVM
jgi:hypothetical protein